MNGFFKQVSLWVLLLVILVLLLTTLQNGQTGKQPIGAIDFAEQLKLNNVKSIRITTPETDKGTYTFKGELKQEVEGRGKTFSFENDSIPEEWKSMMAANAIEPQWAKANSLLGVLLVNVIPLLLIVGLFWFFMFRQMQGGSNKALSFGKSRARLVNHSDKVVTFDDVAGVDEAKEELQEIIEFLKEPKKFSRLGGKIPKGVLLVGPPGSGKTLLARAVAGEAHVPFFSISGSDFVEMFVGVGASRVRDLFQQGQKHAPCIIFIDEIDAVGRQRGAGLGGGHDEREQTLNQLLVEMDGFNTSEGVILMAATNRPDVLDRALLRPGRFDRQIVVANPDIKGREAILGIHIRNNGVPCDASVSVNTLARGTSGFSGADLANMVNEAALLAARRNQDKVTAQDFEDAKDRVLMGPERRSLVLSAKEKKNTAYHEAGHVIVGRLLQHADPVHKVTIIPRGPALGVTSMIPIEDRYSYHKEYCLAAIRMMMGGRAAEEVMFNQFSSGAAGDLKSATELAHRMVCQWGMSEMGPISFGSNNEVFLGRDFMRERDYSEETASAIDKAIHKTLEDAYSDAKKILIEHKNILIALSEELYERETLDAEEIEQIFLKNGAEHLLPVKKESPPPPPYKPSGKASEKKPTPEPEIGGGLGPGDMVPGPA